MMLSHILRAAMPIAVALLPVTVGAAASPPDGSLRSAGTATDHRSGAAEPALVTDLVKRAETAGRNPSDLLSETGFRMQRRGRVMDAIVLFRGALRRAPTDPVIRSRLERARARAAQEFDRRADVAFTQLRFKDALRESQKALQMLAPSESLYVRVSARINATWERLNVAKKPAAGRAPSKTLRSAGEIRREAPSIATDGVKRPQSLRRSTARAKPPRPALSTERVALPDVADMVRTALNDGEFDRAATVVEQALLSEPTRSDLVALAERVSVERRRAAEEVAAAAAQRGDAGDHRGALAAYALARSIDKTLPGVDEAVRRIRESMRVAAASALTCAHVYEAKDRERDAVSCYQRAIENMADDDPDRAEALRRLERLREQSDAVRQPASASTGHLSEASR
jgi:tetratricopeptide (TPR) repeat protein